MKLFCHYRNKKKMLNNWRSFGGVAKKNLILYFALKIKIQCFWMATALPTYKLKIPAIST